VLKTFVACFCFVICGNSFSNPFLNLAFNLVVLPVFLPSEETTSGCASTTEALVVGDGDSVYVGGDVGMNVGGSI
jgi:hypothetical protein